MKRIVFISLAFFFLILGITAGLYLPNSNGVPTKQEIDKMFDPITSKYGIKIVYEIGDDFFSPLENPPIPAGPGRNSKVTPIRYRLLTRYPNILQNALAKYPTQVIRDHLKAIYFAEEITQGKFMAGGSYDPFRQIAYLVNNGKQTDDLAESIFHHEFSSLLLNKHSFFLNPWLDANPKGFKYLYEVYGNFENISDSIVIKGKGTDKEYEEGFVDDYGRTDFENDFNEYSAMIFTYPDKFKKIMNQYPRVRAKFKIWLAFYHKIDPIFTEEYFLGED